MVTFPMSFFLLSAFSLFFLSYMGSNLFSVSLLYFCGVMFLSPEMDLGWRGFFLIWAYISGVFALVVYVSAFSTRSKTKTPGVYMIFFFLPLVYFMIPVGSTLSVMHSTDNLEGFQSMLCVLLSLLPPISYSFGPTVSCRSNLH